MDEETCMYCNAKMILDDSETAPVQGSWHLSRAVWKLWICPKCGTELEWNRIGGYEWKAPPSPTLQGR